MAPEELLLEGSQHLMPSGPRDANLSDDMHDLTFSN